MISQASFLETLARGILDQYGDSTERLVMVFPNRRAGLFFERELTRSAGKALLMPEILSGDEFMSWISGLTLIDDLRLLLEFHTIHKEIEGDKAKSLDDIMGWAEVLLADFNETDLYLADPAGVYTYINEAKAISLWNPDGTAITELQRSYLAFYGSLLRYHTELSDRLLSKRLGYKGLVYRKAAERISGDKLPGALQGKKIIFAGFNALTASEELIFSTLFRRGLADIHWDTDTYYTDDPKQEAGLFIREYLKQPDRFGEQEANDLLSKGIRNFHIRGASHLMDQARECAVILAGMDEEALGRTAVVINDEKLLLPLLHALPANIVHANLTMELSLRYTPAAAFTDSCFELQLSSRKEGVSQLLRTQALLTLLRQPWLRGMVSETEPVKGEEPEVQRKFYIDTAEAIRSLRFSNDEFRKTFHSFIQPGAGPGDFLRRFTQLLLRILDCMDDRDGFDAMIIEELSEAAKTLERSQLPSNISGLRTLRQLFNRLMTRNGLRFSGEPLKGLQIMGMLETRVLDFDTVILTGMNEGMVPKQSGRASFLPMDVRQHFGLPLPHHRDSIYAYHFYRLLQRSSAVHMLYSTRTGKIGTNEMSRFLRQLVWEYPSYNPDARVVHHQPLSFRVDSTDLNPSAPRDEGSRDTLQRWALKGISASSLNMYIKCQLRFYYRYVCHISETDQEGDILEARELGTVIHSVLEEVFSGMEDSGQAQYLRQQSLIVPDLIGAELLKQVQKEVFSSGANFIWKEVAGRILQRFLRNEADRFTREPFHIEGLERKCQRRMQGQDQEYVFSGVIDRIEKSGNTTRVIDYKSGLAEQKNLNFNGDTFLHRDGSLEKGFQLMFYAWLLDGEQPGLELEAGIFSLRALSKGLIPLQINKQAGIGDEQLSLFSRELISIVDEIVYGDNDFKGTETIEHCQFCDYRGICGR